MTLPVTLIAYKKRERVYDGLSMQLVKKRIHSLYRRFFYQTLKGIEGTLRRALFSCLYRVFPRFNAFRLFGLPGGVDHILEGEVVIEPGKERRKKPLTIEKHSHDRFEELEVHPDKERIAILEGGIATATAAHLSANGKLLALFTEQFTMKGMETHKLFTFRFSRCFPSISHFKGCVASLIVDCQQNYYHWLFDALPKLHIIERAHVLPDQFYADLSRPFQRETLALLGISEDQIISPKGHQMLSARELVVTSFPCCRSLPRWVVSYLREQFLEKAEKIPPKRLYLSRRDAVCRRIVNEEELLPFLKKHGFVVIQPEHLSFLQQVSLFHAAEIIIAPHGAGLSNLAFCDSRAKVIEIFSPRFPCICYWALANLLELEYHYFRGEEEASTYAPTGPGQDDILVDPHKLQLTLERAY